MDKGMILLISKNWLKNMFVLPIFEAVERKTQEKRDTRVQGKKVGDKNDILMVESF